MRSKLLEYESTGKFVFHGSSNSEIAQLEPRQATSFGEPDGEPAISASSYIEPAIFMSIISRVSGGAMGIRPTEKNQFGMVVPETTWTKAKNENWQGYVYVLEQKYFSLKESKSWEWRSTQLIRPIDVITVGFEDIYSEVTILPDQEVQPYINTYIRSIT